MTPSPFDMGYDPFKSLEHAPAGVGRRASSVVPSDVNDLAYMCWHIWVGTGGHIRVTTAFGDDVTYKNVPSGTLFKIQATRIWASGTTAQDLVIDA